MKKQRIFITGISGTAGRALAQQVLSESYDVGGTINNNYPPELKELSSKGLKTYQVDLKNSDNIKKILCEFQPDIIFHLAGRVLGSSDKQASSQTIYQENITIFSNVLRGVKSLENSPRLILTSGCLIYDKLSSPNYITEIPVQEIPKIDQELQPYRASKSDQEKLLTKENNLDYVIVRPTQFTGPGKISGVVEWYIANEIRTVLSGQSTSVKVRNKLGELDMLDTRDVASALLTIAKKGTGGEIYHISSGSPITVEHLAKVFLSIADLNPDKYTIESTGPEQLVYFRFSPDKLKRLGWKPQFSLRQTLTSYWEYFKNQEARNEIS